MIIVALISSAKRMSPFGGIFECSTLTPTLPGRCHSTSRIRRAFATCREQSAAQAQTLAWKGGVRPKSRKCGVLQSGSRADFLHTFNKANNSRERFVTPVITAKVLQKLLRD